MSFYAGPNLGVGFIEIFCVLVIQLVVIVALSGLTYIEAAGVFRLAIYVHHVVDSTCCTPYCYH